MVYTLYAAPRYAAGRYAAGRYSRKKIKDDRTEQEKESSQHFPLQISWLEVKVLDREKSMQIIQNVIEGARPFSEMIQKWTAESRASNKVFIGD